MTKQTPFVEFEQLFNNLFSDRSVGFDRFPYQFANVKQANFPPHNLVKFNEDKYVLSLALAGYSQDNIDIELEKEILTVSGELPADDELEYIHRGIAGRKFKKSFVLGEHMEVEGAGMQDGMLHISIVRNVPEEEMPKKISILSKEKEVSKLLSN